MLRSTKRLLALLLALSMLFSMMSMGVSAADAGEKESVFDYPELFMGTDTEVTIDPEEIYGTFQFTPEYDGVYSFFTTGTYDTEGILYDSQMNKLAYNNQGNNFRIDYYLKAGNTYILQVCELNNAVTTLSVFTYLYDSEELTEFEPGTARIDEILAPNAYFVFTAPSDGFYSFTSHSDQDTYGHIYDTYMVELACNDDDGDGLNFLVGYYLTAGTTVLVGARYLSMGLSGSFDVSVSKSPIVAINIDPLTILPDTNCYTDSGYIDDHRIQYSRYQWWEIMQGYATMENGDTVHFTGNEVVYNDTTYVLSSSDDQGVENIWTPGSSHECTVSIGNVSCLTNVNIMTEPNITIELDPLVLPEGYFCHDDYEWNDELQVHIPYNVYDWHNAVTGTLTTADGTQIPITDGYFEYQGQTCYLQNWDDQYEDHWVTGNTYEPYYSVLGNTGFAEVSIVDTVIKDITVEPITLGKDSNGYMKYDESTGEEFFYYDWSNAIRGTVTFIDDSTFEMDGNYVNYLNNTVYVNNTDNQSASTAWEAGQSYTGTFEVLGYEVQVPVTISDKAYYDDYPVLEEEIVSYLVTMPGYEEAGATFTPSTDDIYVFHTEASQYTYLSVWTTEGDFVMSAEGHIILADVVLKGGTTYVIKITTEDYCDIYTFVATTPIESISLNPVTLIEHTGGNMGTYWDEELMTDVKAYQYCWQEHLTGTVYYKDGSSEPLDTSTNEYLDLYINDDQGVTAWTAGNTYECSITWLGVSAHVNVTITPSPITGIYLEPITIMENTCGSMNNSSAGSYYWYEWDPYLRGTVYFADGTSSEINGNQYYYNGQEYSFDWDDPQQYTPFTVGSYTVEASTMNYKATVSISIEQSDLVSLSLKPLTLRINCGGDWTSYWDEETENEVPFYRYRWYDYLEGTAYFRDGTWINFSGSYFYHNGQDYNLNWDDDGQYSDPWQVGNSYTVEIYVSTVCCPVTVTIEAPPQTSELPAMTEGIQHTVMIDIPGKTFAMVFTPSESGSYNFTSYSNMDTYGILYDADWNELAHNDDSPSGGNFLITYYLEAGKTYILESKFYSRELAGSFTVDVSRSPVVSIVANPITIVENTNGHWESRWNPDTCQDEYFYFYNWQDNMQGTIYFSNGDSVPFHGTHFEYQGKYSYISYTQSQYGNPWSIGNTYTETISVSGVSAPVSISIIASPVKYVEFDPITVIENTGGYYCDGWDEYGNYVNYYRYTDWRYNVTGTVYFTDGTSAPFDYNWYEYNGNYYPLEFNDPQSSSNQWLPGNTYIVEGSTMSTSFQTTVTVIGATTSDGYSYIIQNEKVIITDCQLTDAVLEIPETIDGYPVTGIVSLGYSLACCEKLIIPDSVTMLGLNIFYDVYSPMKELVLGAGLKSISANSIHALTELTSIEVSADSEEFVSIDGVLYNKDITELAALPPAYPKTFIIPDTVTNIETMIRFPETYATVKYLPGAGISGLVVIDGVVYDDVVSTVYSISKERTGDLVLPDTVTTIRSHALAGNSLSSITIPETITEITYGSFYNCFNLESVTLPNTIENIYMAAFQNCYNLKSINIPSNCRYISESVFSDCYSLERVDIDNLEAWANTIFASEESNPLYYAGNLYLNGQLVTDLVLTDAVTTAVYSYTFAGIDVDTITIPETVYGIGEGAFYGARISQIDLPDSLRYIEGYAFASSGLTSITFPENLTNAGYYSFANCSDLKSVELNDNLYSIATRTFSGTALSQITIPANVGYIGWNAFQDCCSLEKVVFEGDSIEIYESAFANCPLRHIDLPENTYYIDFNAFSGSAVASLALPESVTQYTYRSFAFNDTLLSVVIPTSVNSIDGTAFEGCDNLGHVLYEGTQEQWNQIYMGSANISDAKLHLQASAEDITLNYYCHQIQHYCAICNQWEFIELGGYHNYEDGVCTSCGYNQYSASVNGESFESLDEALDAATTGDAIELYNNIATDSLTLESGAKLDLNGSTLIVSDGIVVFDGEIVDSSEGEAALVIEKDALVLSEDNAQMPLYDTTTGSYRFYSYTVSIKGIRENPDGSVTYGFRFDFGGRSAYDVLKETEDSGLSGMFYLSWPGSDKMDFTFSDDLIRQYADLSAKFGDKAALMVTITGLDTLDPGTELTANAVVLSDKGMSKMGDNMFYTTAE